MAGQKFQDVVDWVPVAAQRDPEAPSELFLERQRAFSERAKRIESLRNARINNVARVERRPLLFEVVRHRGHWRVLHHSRHSAPHADQAAAILAAKTRARKKRDQGHLVEVVLRRTDGGSVPQAIDEAPQS